MSRLRYYTVMLESEEAKRVLLKVNYLDSKNLFKNKYDLEMILNRLDFNSLRP